VIVKLTLLLVPPEVDTVTLASPSAAAGSIVKLVLNDVDELTLTAPTVTPLPDTATVVCPTTKPVPVSVTPDVVPAVPLDGEI
jgi:hypothetical protein